MTAPLAWLSARIRAATRSARPRGAPRCRGSGRSGRGRRPADLAVRHLDDQHGLGGEDPRGAGRGGPGQPVEGFGRVDVERHAGQRGQQGRRPLGALPGPGVAQRRHHHGEQFLGLVRVGQVGVGALGQAPGAVGDLDRGGGDLDDRDGRGGRVGLDPAADLVADHVGQVDVEQDQLGGARPSPAPPARSRPRSRCARPGAARCPSGSAWPRRRRPGARRPASCRS